MSTLQETFARLAALHMFEAGTPASEYDIQRIETELGLVLPGQYVEFLKQFGSARSFGWHIFGTRPVVRPNGRRTTLTQDCIEVTKKEKSPNSPLGTASLPPAHVVISSDGGGGNFVLFGVGSPYDGQVHYYNFEDQAEPIKVWKTFQDYLEQRTEEAVGA